MVVDEMLFSALKQYKKLLIDAAPGALAKAALKTKRPTDIVFTHQLIALVAIIENTSEKILKERDS